MHIYYNSTVQLCVTVCLSAGRLLILHYSTVLELYEHECAVLHRLVQTSCWGNVWLVHILQGDSLPDFGSLPYVELVKAPPTVLQRVGSKGAQRLQQSKLTADS
eukprot:1315-Heterococcus_DN1.PRE.3